MKTLFFVFIILGSVYFAQAQQASKTVISGNLFDCTTKQPVQYALASLVRFDDGVEVAENVSLVNGYFKMEDLPAGNYQLRIQASGYSLMQTASITVFNAETKIYLGKIMLSPASNEKTLLSASSGPKSH